jgi:tRNA A37 threonylcarbamoyladenosine synthetase subunit TsaC/SUA5/YrdC
MALATTVHPENPQARLIYQVVEIIRKGGVIVYPTDTGYALGCHIGDKRRFCDFITQIYGHCLFNRNGLLALYADCT